MGGEDFGFENVEFVRERAEGTQWPVMYMYYVCGSWTSGEREVKVGNTYLKTVRW